MHNPEPLSPEEDPAMPRTSKQTTPSKGWSDRKGRFKNVQIHRDLAVMLLEVAQDGGLSIAELIDQLTRPTVAGKYRAILERRLAEVVGDQKAQPARTRKTG
jgi:hypothetical protein